MINLKEISLVDDLSTLPDGKLLINTINAHSYNVAKEDELFSEALSKGDVLIPDGASIVMACKWLHANSQPKKRVAGWDLFVHEMNQLNEKGGTCFFMGSSEKVLARIKDHAAETYPNIREKDDHKGTALCGDVRLCGAERRCARNRKIKRPYLVYDLDKTSWDS